jgi:hypothetical protein
MSEPELVISENLKSNMLPPSPSVIGCTIRIQDDMYSSYNENLIKTETQV